MTPRPPGISGFFLSLARLDVFPGSTLVLGRSDLPIAEDMGVSPYHLLADGPGDLVEVEMAGLARHLGVVDDLQEQIAKLVLEIVEILASDRVGDLVGLLDRIGRDGREGLLDIPRAAAFRIAKPGHDFEQSGQRFRHGRGAEFDGP